MIAIDPGSSRVAARAGATDALAAHGIETAALDARILVEEALGITATDLALRGAEPVGEAGAALLTAYLARRVAGEPVARIIGAWEFWGLPFGLSPETLVPRPDTETLVEAALRSRPEGPARIADLGTGSGCILVALLTEWPHSFGIGLDRSPGALSTARANAARNGVADRAAFVAGDWAASLMDRSTSWWRTRPTSPARSSPACPGRCGTTIRGWRWMAEPTGSTPTAPSWPRCRPSWRRAGISWSRSATTRRRRCEGSPPPTVFGRRCDATSPGIPGWS